MLNDLYTFSVPVFLRGHAVLSELLRKGEAHAAGYKITPSALLTARLFPDMFPLTGQVQAACDTAKRATARLVGVEPPRFEDNEATFEELYARIQRTSEFVEKFQADAFRDADTRKIELKMSAGVVSLTIASRMGCLSSRRGWARNSLRACRLASSTVSGLRRQRE